MEYDRGKSFPFDFEPNEIPFGPKLKYKLLRRSYTVQSKGKKNLFFQAYVIASGQIVPEKIEVCTRI